MSGAMLACCCGLTRHMPSVRGRLLLIGRIAMVPIMLQSSTLGDAAMRPALPAYGLSRFQRLRKVSSLSRGNGDGRDFRFQPGEVCKFINALLSDHGGVHVGQKQLLAAVDLRLHDDVDW